MGIVRSVTIVVVNFDSLFYIRLLVEKVRQFVGSRSYEIIVVDRGSRDGSREWLRKQADVRLILKRQWRHTRHSHGEAVNLFAELKEYRAKPGKHKSGD